MTDSKMTAADFLAESRRFATVALPRMRKALEAVLALHRPTYPAHWAGDAPACFHCVEPGNAGGFTWVEYPCPTVHAIESALAGEES